MAEARLIRTLTFRAWHRYGAPDAPREENAARFGAQASPHPHEWRVVFHVAGPIDPETGWCVDLAAVDGAFDRATEGWRGGDLNRVVGPVREGTVQPSCEELARHLHGSVAAGLPPGVRLLHVEVHESDRLGAAYPADP